MCPMKLSAQPGECQAPSVEASGRRKGQGDPTLAWGRGTLIKAMGNLCEAEKPDLPKAADLPGGHSFYCDQN